MIYTSYFGNAKNLDPHVYAPVSIAGGTPNWFDGLEYKALAPSYDIWKEYQETHDNDLYVKRFYEERLNKLNPKTVVLDLMSMVGNYKNLNYLPDIVLLCYEPPGSFCHRHLVADWLKPMTKVIELPPGKLHGVIIEGRN